MVEKCKYCGTVNMFNKTGYCKACDHRLTDITPENKYEQPEKQKEKAQTIIECSIDKETTIERLVAMDEITRIADKSGNSITFHCQRSGSFTVQAAGSAGNVYVSGEVIDENGKTKVLIEENTNSGKANKFSQYLYLSVILIFAALYLASRVFFMKYKANMLDLIFTVSIIYFVINQMLNIKKQKDTTAEDLLIMKGEVIRRIRAVEKWDD